jgi:hypothetical protein
MTPASTPDLITEIGRKTAQLGQIARRGEALELDRLRDETAALQALIAEAQRLQRAAGA